jgi:hypothetical protein
MNEFTYWQPIWSPIEEHKQRQTLADAPEETRCIVDYMDRGEQFVRFRRGSRAHTTIGIDGGPAEDAAPYTAGPTLAGARCPKRLGRSNHCRIHENSLTGMLDAFR